MAENEQRILITHEDGRSYSVTPAVFRERYEPEGFKDAGPETPGDFVANVPKVPTRAGARRKTTKAARPARRAGAKVTEADVAVAGPGGHVDHQAIAADADELEA